MTRYIEDKGLWVPDYTVGGGLGTRLARGLWKLGFKQTPGCGCGKAQRWLDGPRRPIRTMPPISGGVNVDNVEDICVNDNNVIFCENWENRPLGWIDNNFGQYFVPSQFKNTGWVLTSPTGGTVVNTEHFEGTKSLQITTPANQSSGGEADTINNSWANRREFYWRTYEKFSPNYVWSPIGTKNWEQLHVGQSQDIDYFNGVSSTTRVTLPDPVIIAFGSNDPRGEFCGTPCRRFHQNGSQGNITIVPNQWYCMEVHLRYNTGSNSFDGALEAWIDGVQYWNYPNAHISTVANDNMQGIEYITYWNCGGPGGNDCHGPQAPDFLDFTHPAISRYIDGIIVSLARIGCGGASPGDTTAPSVTITGPTSNPSYLTKVSPL
jgi:hypothetical protein